jgi:ankyrin repeat protein
MYYIYKKMNNLSCPVTHEKFKDPVCMPCCGNTFSRESLITWFSDNDTCMMCRKDLTDINFDPKNAPTCVQIGHMIDESNEPQLEQEEKETIVVDNSWICEAVPIKLHKNKNNYDVAKISVYKKNTDPSENKFKTLFIPVIDRSGSMSGNPKTQTEFACHQMIDMTYQNKHLITSVVLYDNNVCHLDIDTKDFNKQYHKTMITNEIQKSGGTSFVIAFEEIVTIIKKYKNAIIGNVWNDISSISIIFMTDGQAFGDKVQMVKTFKENVESVTDKQFQVHTIGFGGGHDAKFLNDLRMAGTNEGAYRFASPADDLDELSNKISSVSEVVAKTIIVPMKIISTNMNVVFTPQTSSELWVSMRNITNDNNIVVDFGDSTITSAIKNFFNNGNKNTTLPINIKKLDEQNEDYKKITNEWISIQVDSVVNEIIFVSTQSNSIVKNLRIELTLKKINALRNNMMCGENELNRLTNLINIIECVKNGESIDQNRLMDMKFEGTYTTKKSTQEPVQKRQTFTTSNYNMASHSYNKPTENVWLTYPYSHNKYKKVNVIDNLIKNYGDTDESEENIKKYVEFSINCILGSYEKKGDLIQSWNINNLIYSNNLLKLHDGENNNIFGMIAKLGKVDCMRKLCEHFGNIRSVEDLVNHKNKNNMTSLDVAILNGFYHTAGILLENNGKFSSDPTKLVCTCLENNFTTSAGIIAKHNTLLITDDLINSSPTNAIQVWLSNKSQKDISIEMMITKGMIDEFLEKIESVDYEIKLEQFMKIFMKSTDEQNLIFDYLFKNNKANPMEIFSVTTNSDEDAEITCPIFLACEKGNIGMFNVIMRYSKKESITFKNNKGTSCLWIASCNKYIDIVEKLIEFGCDVNDANKKGDNALIPACQKGSVNIVELLLNANISTNCFNLNRDNAVMICCRSNQSKILEILLHRLNKDQLKDVLEWCADIDGFNPLLSSTEMDNYECVKICLKYGADIEFKTKEDNDIIAGGASVHIACMYGCFKTLKLLNSMGVNMNSRSHDGSTPLHVAIKKKQSEIIKYLIESCEIDLTLCDNNGKTPEFYAKSAGNEETYNEFFADKLSIIMSNIFYNDDVEIKNGIIDTIKQYDNDNGFYEFNDIMKTKIGNDNMHAITHVILNGDKELLEMCINKNVNFNNKDENGISPALWLTLLNYNNLNNEICTLDEETMELCNVINNVKNKSLQNKSLMTLSQGIPKCENGMNMLTINEKMNDGCELLVKKSVMMMLQNTSDDHHSLLQFTEDMKTEKMSNIKNAKSIMEYMIWDSKVHIINTIVKNKNNLNGLQPVNLLAIYLYTSNESIFRHVNNTLVNWDKNDKESKGWKTYVSCLYQSINLLPSHKGELYRSVNIKFDAEHFGVGKTLNWNAFGICSSEWSTCSSQIENKTGVIFIVDSKNGKNISTYSKYPANNEYVFLPDTKFIVKNHYVACTTALGQANIRESTYKMRPQDYDLVIDNKVAIIIHIEEIINHN